MEALLQSTVSDSPTRHLLLHGFKVTFQGDWVRPVESSLKQHAQLRAKLQEFGCEFVQSANDKPDIVFHRKPMYGNPADNILGDEDDLDDTQSTDGEGNPRNRTIVQDRVLHITEDWFELLAEYHRGMPPQLVFASGVDYFACDYEDPEYREWARNVLTDHYVINLERELMSKSRALDQANARADAAERKRKRGSGGRDDDEEDDEEEEDEDGGESATGSAGRKRARKGGRGGSTAVVVPADIMEEMYVSYVQYKSCAPIAPLSEEERALGVVLTDTQKLMRYFRANPKLVTFFGMSKFPTYPTIRIRYLPDVVKMYTERNLMKQDEEDDDMTDTITPRSTKL